MKQDIFVYNNCEYDIYIGQNSKENFDIIDSCVDTDIWFHVENMPSCHVILKTNDNMKNIPRQVIKRCAYLCRINSNAKTLKKCIIIYTTINNVTKTNIMGQVSLKQYKQINV